MGLDLSPAAIRQAREDARRLGIGNARFEEGMRAAGRFGCVIAIFFLHHLPDDERELEPETTAGLFRRAGLRTQAGIYGLASSPLAGLLPGWRAGYRAMRAADARV